MKDLMRVRRGDVFFCKSNTASEGSVESKNRPVVVVSNDKGNSTSTTCVVCPITSRDETTLPVHVKYHTDKPQVILCEQIKTVTMNSLRDYYGHLSDEIMKKVDKALRIQLDLLCVEDAYPDSEDNSPSVSDKVVITPYVSTTSEITPNTVSDPSTNTSSVPANTNHPERRMTQIEKFNAKYNMNAQAPASPKTPEPFDYSRSKYFKTEDEMREFLKDCDKLSAEAVAKKWSMAVKHVYNQKYLVKRRLGE